MCIITFQLYEHPKYKLMVAANRDEAYARPSKPAHFWPEAPELLAGKDLKAGGTWLGITKRGKFAAITNFRDVQTMYQKYPKSRGDIVTSFLLNEEEPPIFLEKLKKHRHDYGGFNLLVGTVNKIYYYSPQLNQIETLHKGVYSVSNGHLDSNWPKMKLAKTRLSQISETDTSYVIPTIFNHLQDDREAQDEKLPDTGIDIELERQLSSIFIRTKGYGTKSSTVLLVTHDNQVEFVERTYLQNQNENEFKDVHYTFQITHPNN